MPFMKKTLPSGVHNHHWLPIFSVWNQPVAFAHFNAVAPPYLSRSADCAAANAAKEKDHARNKTPARAPGILVARIIFLTVGLVASLSRATCLFWPLGARLSMV